MKNSKVKSKKVLFKPNFYFWLPGELQRIRDKVKANEEPTKEEWRMLRAFTVIVKIFEKKYRV